MHNVPFLSILSLLILSSPLSASDSERSLVSSLLHSQFPFNSRNTVEKQRQMSRRIVANMLDDVFSDGEFQAHVYATFTASRLLNKQQQLLNIRANTGLLTAIPFMFHSKTRKIGIGMLTVAGALKLDAAYQLPLIDVEHVHDSLKEIEKSMAAYKHTWKMPSSPQNTSDII